MSSSNPNTQENNLLRILSIAFWGVTGIWELLRNMHVLVSIILPRYYYTYGIEWAVSIMMLLETPFEKINEYSIQSFSWPIFDIVSDVIKYIIEYILNFVNYNGYNFLDDIDDIFYGNVIPLILFLVGALCVTKSILKISTKKSKRIVKFLELKSVGLVLGCIAFAGTIIPGIFALIAAFIDYCNSDSFTRKYGEYKIKMQKIKSDYLDNISTKNTSDSTLKTLEKLGELRKKGIITEEEFISEKKKLL